MSEGNSRKRKPLEDKNSSGKNHINVSACFQKLKKKLEINIR